MNNVGIVPVQDYISNIANEQELDDLERRIQARRELLASHAKPPQDPMKTVRDLCKA
jgi:hypothetical protein